MADPQDVQESLKSLRRRLDELESRRRRAMGDLRSAILGTALAASMVVLTATTWAVDGEDPYTLWGLVPEGWPAFAMLALVVGTALTTTLLFLSDPPSRTGHLAMVWISLLTAAWVIAVNTTVPEDSHTAPGRWLTLLAALATATAHGTRAEDLCGTKRP